MIGTLNSSTSSHKIRIIKIILMEDTKTVDYRAALCILHKQGLHA